MSMRQPKNFAECVHDVGRLINNPGGHIVWALIRLSGYQGKEYPDKYYQGIYFESLCKKYHNDCGLDVEALAEDTRDLLKRFFKWCLKRAYKATYADKFEKKTTIEIYQAYLEKLKPRNQKQVQD